MFLDLKDIDRDGVDFDHRPRWSTVDGPDGEECPVAGARVAGRVAPGARGIELRGRVRAVAELRCSRCLETVPVEVDAEVFLVLVEGESGDRPGEREIDAEDADLFEIEGARVDLDEVAREQVVLALPIKAVCSPDCRGLCPECGSDRNRVDCGCAGETIDPRLAPLLRMRRKDEAET